METILCSLSTSSSSCIQRLGDSSKGMWKALMQTPNLAVAAVALTQKLRAVQAQLAAAGLSVPGSGRRRRTRSPRESQTNTAGATTSAVAGSPPPPPAPIPGSCHVFWRTGKCTFERCSYKHLDKDCKKHPKIKVTVQAKGQAKEKAQSNSPRRSPPEILRIPQQKRAVPCKFVNTIKGCRKGDKCEFGH